VAPGEARAGTYALLLWSAAHRRIQVGRLGAIQLRRGWYVYVGSARGPGGVRARLAHHLRVARRPHWHVDYLRRHAAIREIWTSYDARADEHRWARVLAAAEGAQAPCAGFGSSDCSCGNHLFFFRQRPVRAIFSGVACGVAPAEGFAPRLATANAPRKRRASEAAKIAASQGERCVVPRRVAKKRLSPK
jgi:Uri superfamily endonuclease